MPFPSRKVILTPVKIGPGATGANVELVDGTIIGAVISGRQLPKWWQTRYQAMTPLGELLGQPTRDIYQPVQRLIDRWELAHG